MSRDVIVFAGALYDSPLWTNRQHVATRLSKRGWRVLYVEPRNFLPRMFLGRFPGTCGPWKWLLRSWSPWRAQQNLWVFSQVNVVPGSRKRAWVSAFNHRMNAWRVLLCARSRRFRRPALLLYDTEAVQYLPAFPNSRVVYDCVDDHRAQAGVRRNPARVEMEEQGILARADAVAVTTESLLRRFQGQHPAVHLVPNVADVSAFLSYRGPEPDDIANIPHPRIGTVGALDGYKLDVALLGEVAQKRPSWNLVLVGPVEFVGKEWEERLENVLSLQHVPNIHFLGQKPYGDIPATVHAFDVAMIPYRESAYNRSSFPLKFWEFMASGTPVVATGLPSLALYGHLATLATSRDEFIAGVEHALLEQSEKRKKRVEEATRHDWDTRVKRIEELLETPA